eukprot:c14780_g1_i2.p1 GENE.c14780_g1_i2~~c14780_g1_i2.p1  ORF type:complete len:298 (-),score=50.84 c14780_g1_i2:61-840(-)
MIMQWSLLIISAVCGILLAVVVLKGPSYLSSLAGFTMDQRHAQYYCDEHLPLPEDSNVRVLILQTSDDEGSQEALVGDKTEQINTQYAQKWGLHYERFKGLKPPLTHSAHAKLNRIIHLRELIAMPKFYEFDWVAYLDPTFAFANDTINIARELARRPYANVALVGLMGQPDLSLGEINSTVVMFNTHHPATTLIIQDWADLFASIPKIMLRATHKWNTIVPKDQKLLNRALHKYAVGSHICFVHRELSWARFGIQSYS